MQDLRIVFLGTSSGTPTRERNVSSVAIAADRSVILFDCGEGTQHQLLRAPVKSGAIEAIFISHLHGDHVYGLPGLLATLSMNGRTRPLALFGPEGLRDYIESMLRTSHHHPQFEVRITEVEDRQSCLSSVEDRQSCLSVSSVEDPPGQAGLPVQHRFRIEWALLDHSIPSLGYLFIEDDLPGKFDVAKARALGIEPGPIYRDLVRARDPRVLGPSRAGRRIAYCTDTRYCAASVALARGADVLIHESTYDESMAAEAHERFHATCIDAARVAAEAGVGRLILTHFSARYGDTAPLVEQARRVFENTVAAEELAQYDVVRR